MQLIHLLAKVFSCWAISESSEKFQTTTRKSLDSVVKQLHYLVLARLVYCLRAVLLVRRGYMVSRNCDLLHSCGRMCTTDPQTIFFILRQLKNNSISLHLLEIVGRNLSKFRQLSKKMPSLGGGLHFVENICSYQVRLVWLLRNSFRWMFNKAVYLCHLSAMLHWKLHFL